ncbi:coiled-coil domain-containing protein 97 [Battus philenor]|uniref:coiled-coil domain-containing protein 97 n=1 Tax=Battus philenor TaxID=42288 RepID=UPI0035CF4747
MEQDADQNKSFSENGNEDVDPITDIIDYLVRCANISLKGSHVNESQIKTSDKIKIAHEIFHKSPTYFLLQFGKYLSPHHLPYFENLVENRNVEDPAFVECLKNLKIFHSERNTYKRIRNRRYRALQKMQNETDYFTEKQMMFRNPLLYEQLIGQYLSDEEILHRDTGDMKDLTFVNIILNTVDMNEMNEAKHRQMLAESLETEESDKVKLKEKEQRGKKMWGDFDVPDPLPSIKLKTLRADAPINSNEMALLREEFFQEMYSSFLDGRDVDIDYDSIDNNDQYDDLQQISQDAEDKYFDSENNDVDNLEEHMELVQEYGKKLSIDQSTDSLDVYMKHIDNKINSI